MAGTDTLTITTPSSCEVEMTRMFDAPRRLVFDALTRPELLKRWLEAPGRTLEVCEIDFRVGGAYRFVWRGPGKTDVGTRGVYREIAAPGRIVNNEAWEDWDAGETLVTTTLAESGGRTLLTSTVLFPSEDVRDAVLKAGMQNGAAASYDKLAAMLASYVSQ
jgi:uncharacterized protein YndB with AHSA1/START domain